jgi:type VI secretion system protein ImpI
MNMTTIQSAENNPLKFSVTPEDAIENMFAKEGKAYLSPIDAMNDGFSDISEHQVALFDAMRAAYEHILGQFDPSFLAQKFEKTSSKRFLGYGKGKGKNWDAYLALFEEYKEDNELTFKRLFGEVFADAYERRMHSLKMNRKSSSSNKSGK